jgi:hypothetical protein
MLTIHTRVLHQRQYINNIGTGTINFTYQGHVVGSVTVVCNNRGYVASSSNVLLKQDISSGVNYIALSLDSSFPTFANQGWVTSLVLYTCPT